MRPFKHASQVVRQCIVEILERRQLLSHAPAPYPGFVGPLPMRSDPLTQTVAPGSGPMAELAANPMLAAGTGSYTFMITYRASGTVQVSSIDSFDIYVHGPNGYVRRALLVSVDANGNGPVRTARYKVGPPNGAWGHVDNGLYRVVLQEDQVFDNHGNPAPGGIVGEFLVNIPGGSNPPPAPILFGVDVRSFGAFPNDGIDDTDAIQAAINSLPVSDGVPAGHTPAGGILLFPEGVFDITRALRLPSSVTLRGAGPNTVIHHVGANRNEPAIQLYSPFVHRNNVGATVENLSIYTRWSGGIWIDPAMNGKLIDLRLANLRISALGPAIDLRSEVTYHSEIDNVEVYNPGSTALYLGRFDGVGANLLVRNFSVTGTARSGFRAEEGLVIITSDVLVQGLKISARTPALPLYMTNADFVGGSKGVTLYDVAIDVPTASLPGGLVAHFRDMARVDIDLFSGVGLGRRLVMTNAHDVQIRYMRSDGSSNVLSHITSKDSGSYLRVGNAANGRLNYPPRANQQSGHVRTPMPTLVIDATAFGVNGDDELDDTVALQRAIDSLPKGNGLPEGPQAVGGIVQLPSGTIRTNAPIKLPSGVWLRGHNNATIIRNSSANWSEAVIELTSPYPHRSNVGAGLDSVGIYSWRAAGVKADFTLTGELRDFHMSGVNLNTGRTAIDLRDVQVNYGNFEHILVANPGSGAIWLGRSDNSSVGNVVRNLRTARDPRPDFQTDLAMFVFFGDTRIEGGSLEDVWDQFSTAPLPGMYFSGSGRIEGMFSEWASHPSQVGFVFDNATGVEIDRLHHITPWRRIDVRNGSNVLMRSLSIDGVTSELRDNISVDGSSRFTLNTVYSQFDSGMLDHPRVIVKGNYNKRAERFIETAVATSGNLLADPNMNSVTDVYSNPKDWTIVWADGWSGKLGTFTVETVGGVRRLRIDVPNPTYFHIRIRVNVPMSAVGKDAIATWRLEGPLQPLVYKKNNVAQYAARVMKSMTAIHAPTPLAAGEEIWINVGGFSNWAPAGTYYISRVGIVAV